MVSPVCYCFQSDAIVIGVYVSFVFVKFVIRVLAHGNGPVL